MLKLMGKKYLQFYAEKLCLSKHVGQILHLLEITHKLSSHLVTHFQSNADGMSHPYALKKVSESIFSQISDGV